MVLKAAGLGKFYPNYLSVEADFSLAAWNTIATHEVFTVTGAVRMQVLIECTETLADAADGASIQFGSASLTSALIASTGAAGAGGNTISIGEFWLDATPADLTPLLSDALLDFVVAAGLDIGYEITGAALTDGKLKFHCWWEAISSDGNVAAGTGAAL